MLSFFKKKEKEKGAKDISKKFQDSPIYQSYLKTLGSISKSDTIILVFDARNPFSCRYQAVEQICDKKAIYVLNKIDLIPRESAIIWLRAFQCLGPSFAISANHDISPLSDYLKQRNPKSISIHGIQSVGKKTIANKLEKYDIHVNESLSWIWLKPTSDLLAMGAFTYKDLSSSVVHEAHDFLSRCSIHSLMDVFKVPFFNDAMIILRNLGETRRTASIAFFQGLSESKFLYYAIPPIYGVQLCDDPFTPLQVAALRFSLPSDAIEDSIINLGYGTTNSMLPTLIPLIIHNREIEKEERTSQ